MLVTTQIQDGWAEITLNRPETRNAIIGPLGDELSAAIRACDVADEVAVVLLRGADGAFCSGLDLNEFNAEPAPSWLAGFSATWRAVHVALYECRKPLIVALEKYAINGGAALALAADLLIVGDDSFLQVGEVQIGAAAPYNLAWLRLRQAETVIAQLTLVGRRFTGAELYRLGVAYAAPSTSSCLATARDLAVQLAGYPKGAAARIKHIMRKYHGQSASEWFDIATSAAPGGGRLRRVGED